MSQKSHLIGEANSLYRGYRLAMGKSPKNVRPRKRDITLTRSQTGVKQNATQLSPNQKSVQAVRVGFPDASKLSARPKVVRLIVIAQRIKVKMVAYFDSTSRRLAISPSCNSYHSPISSIKGSIQLCAPLFSICSVSV